MRSSGPYENLDMKALWRHQPLTVRLGATVAGILTAATAFAASAEANPSDDAFIGALNDAGVNYGDAGTAATLGHSLCQVLAEPGGSFNTAASHVVAAQSGISPQMATIFTSIAISTYCPAVLAGNLPALSGISGG